MSRPLPPIRRWSRSPLEAEPLVLAVLDDLGWQVRPVSVPFLGDGPARQHPECDSAPLAGGPSAISCPLGHSWS